MPPSDTTYDAASALIVGGRDHQEDAIIADFPVGSDIGVVVLSDGMGGHAAGDVASKIIMTEMFCELKFQGGDPEKLIADAPAILRNAATSANECLRAHIDQNPALKGMGATLLTLLMRDNELRWLSVGDSPLYLFRGTELRQLNEDHSMAPRIDAMVSEGILTAAQAKDHPDRNALLSVCSGDPIQKVDCKEEPFKLEHGDIVIAASDGLQYLELDVISGTINRTRGETSARIARALLDEIEALGDPEQDNTSMAIIKVASAKAAAGVEDVVRSAFSLFADNDDDEDDDDEAAEPIAAESDVEETAAEEVADASDETDADKTEAAESPEPEVSETAEAKGDDAAKADSPEAAEGDASAKEQATADETETPETKTDDAAPETAKTDDAKTEQSDKAEKAKGDDKGTEKAKAEDDAPPKPKVEPPSEDVIIAFVAEQMRAAAAEAEAEAKAKAEAEEKARAEAEAEEASAADDAADKETVSRDEASEKEKAV